ncbi:glycosyltransferase [Halalkalibacter akibai JCM 9157]|uniref:Glycosyltransferase n=2 Tax=Halalkalibacter akibai TaxID=1411 RepID=W4QVL7_HALA3|nr:glycosyltransferase [Halalkalibacter akibai JCM 9157]
MKWFKEQGWDVHVAASGTLDLPFTDQKFDIPIKRSPFDIQNIKAFKELKRIIDQNQYEIIHCHTPLGGVLARLAAKQARKTGTKVIYTAHGFHFCKGAPITNWLVYYPIERYLSRFTDSLITINSEDYQLAKSHRFQAKQIEHVHGVGVDTERFKPHTEARKVEERIKLGYGTDDFLLFYAAEFNRNKNQQLLIRSLAQVKDELPQARLLLAGEGVLMEECKALARTLNVEERVEFLGFRKDIDQLLPICDLAVASSLREGLPVNIMEAMACGLPVVASENRGHFELIEPNRNGYLVNAVDIHLFSNYLVDMYQSKELLNKLGKGSIEVINKYSLQQTSYELSVIYSRYMEDQNEAKSQYHRAYL